MPAAIKPGQTEITPRAVQFAAGVDFSSDVQSENQVTEKPVTIVARSSSPADHPFWGPSVHDFSGLVLPAQPVPIDYCHDPGQVLGVADKFEVTGGNLVVSGKLVAFGDDRASEVIAKSGKGVPYQSSIQTGMSDLEVEWLAEGVSTEVNDQMVEGPLFIFRKWSLRGVAICPYGSDSETSVQFAAGMGSAAKIQVKEFEPMSTNADQAAGTTATASNETTTEATQSTEGKPKVEEQTTEATQATTTVAEVVDRASEGSKFTAAFGAQGALYFTAGLSFEQAQVKHMQALEQKVKEQEAQIAKFTASSNLGEATPLTGSGVTAPKGEPNKFSAQLGPALGAFAADTERRILRLRGDNK